MLRQTWSSIDLLTNCLIASASHLPSRLKTGLKDLSALIEDLSASWVLPFMAQARGACQHAVAWAVVNYA